uniref:Uncharacterized protein n=1 Tax=Solanum lycopersicum TaxID=4081 RepID=A0A3Q7GDM3_SOLLC
METKPAPPYPALPRPISIPTHNKPKILHKASFACFQPCKVTVRCCTITKQVLNVSASCRM